MADGVKETVSRDSGFVTFEDSIHGNEEDNGYFQLMDRSHHKQHGWSGVDKLKLYVCNNIRLVVGVTVVILLIFTATCIGFVILSEKIETLNRNIQQMKNDSLMKESMLKEQIQIMQIHNDGMKKELLDKEKILQNRLSYLEDNSTRVAFSAYMKRPVLRPVNDTLVTVPFDVATVNVGNHYDNDTSTFTCPLTALYMFTYTIFSGNLHISSRHEANARLTMNGKVISRAVCTNSDNTERNRCMATGVVLQHCDQGSKVYITASSDNNRIYGGGYRHTTFSGFLLY